MNSLVDYGTSSDDSGSDTQDDKCEPAESPASKLPKPDFDGSSSARSVFSNPFVEAEHKERAILEKHVKMVSTQGQLINGKKICWNHRKGRCRFGHNCKFAHDDLQQIDDSADSRNNKQAQSLQSDFSSQMDDEQREDTWEEGTTKTKNKRPGLSQNIIPGKKVLKMYKRQKTAATKH